MMAQVLWQFVMPTLEPLEMTVKGLRVLAAVKDFDLLGEISLGEPPMG